MYAKPNVPRLFHAFWVLLGAIALGPLAGVAGAQTAPPVDPVIERIRTLGLEQSQVMEHLEGLCVDIGPRLTGSANLARACEVTQEWFTSFGLSNVHLEEWGEFAVGFNRGPWSGRMIEPQALELTCGTNSWTPGTDGPRRGRAVLAPVTEEDLESTAGSLQGCWILDRNPSLEDADQRRAFEQRRLERYRSVGALGVLRPARGELITTMGSAPKSMEDLPQDVRITVIRSQFEDLAARVAAGEAVVLEFDIHNEFVPGPIKNHNVVADLPGSEWPDQFVIVGGHLDSWDGASGCTDNGTGASTTLEAARILAAAGARPRRTIRFILWTGEEQGLYGSRDYVEDHAAELEAISAVFVHDGGTNYVSGISATAAMKADFDQVFAPVLELSSQLPFEVAVIEGLSRGGSDHDSYLSANVPAFFWNQAGRAVYRDTWHTHQDHYPAAIPEYQMHSATAIALAAYGTANLDHLLSREKLVAPRRGGGRRLGISLAEDGRTIEGVRDEGLAKKAGMLAGDRLIRIGEVEIKTREDVMSALQGGEAIKVVEILRGEAVLRYRVDWNAGTAELLKEGGG